MRWNKKYLIVIEDESSLEKKVNSSVQLPWLILILVALIFVAGMFGVFIITSTPLRNMLPGYLKESERTATEEQHLRLDSLVRVYEINEAYITGILDALNPSEVDSVRNFSESRHIPLSADSLMEPSEDEKLFMERIREREKYNISYASPAAAQTMMFGTVNNKAIISEPTLDKFQAEIILPDGAPVSAIADGKVISVANSPKSSGAYEIIIQHSKGFLSKSSHLTNLLVKPGDRVVAGQIIATGVTKRGLRDNHMIFELWHDGDQLIPSQYLNSGMDNR